jgi:tRNA(fMet)-specific endonuclease VapC
MFLLDTDVLSMLFREHPSVTERFLRVSATEFVATTVISRIEILRGRFDFLLKAADEAELRRARDSISQSERHLAAIRQMQLEESGVLEFERLRKIKSLRKIGRADLLIACVVLANRATLVTRNVKDFKLVPGLKYENWAD